MFPNLPLFTAHWRMKMRPARFYAVILGTLATLLAMGITIFASEAQQGFKVFAIGCLVGQYLVLTAWGSSEIAVGIGRDIYAEILPFHRLTPMSLHSILAGYLLGLPSAPYLVWLILALAGFIASLGPESVLPVHYLLISARILLSAWFFHMVAALGALLVPRKIEQRSVKNLNSMAILPLLCLSIPLEPMFLTALPLALRFLIPPNNKVELSWFSTITFFTKPVPLEYYSLLLLGVFGFLVYRAVRRRMEFLQNSALSKTDTMLFILVLGIFTIGRTIHLCQNPQEAAIIRLAVTIGFTVICLISVTFVIPTRLLLRQDLIKRIEENKWAFFWEDRAPALPAVIALVSLSLLPQAVIHTLTHPNLQMPHELFPWKHIGMTLALGVFLVGFIEGCRLRFSKDSTSLVVVVCSIWWFLPYFIFWSVARQEFAIYILGLSPLSGLLVDIFRLERMPQIPWQQKLPLLQMTSLCVTFLAAIMAQSFRYRAQQALVAAIKGKQGHE